MSEAQKLLSEIQQELKAPKNQYNKFGKYKYRNCEDILTAVKPLLRGAILTLTDEMVGVLDRVYVKSTATFCYEGASVFVCGWAREAETKKGMDDSQITGSASSYARKYALNGLFCIDDTKDSDAREISVDEVLGWIDSADSLHVLEGEVASDISSSPHSKSDVVRGAYKSKLNKLKG